jgi:Kef-type K+ transport system membrane component KefB
VFVGTLEVTLLVLLFAILAGPIVADRFRIPGLLGLIFFGMLFGPHVLGWLGRIDLVDDLGAIGILYLMFLAGLGFNLKAFAENRTSAIGFGLLGFAAPFAISVVTGMVVLDYGLLAAALVGAMWASNTLVAYPDVRAAGLADTRPVRDAVSGGVVADMLSLLVLAVATSYEVIDTVETEAVATTVNADRAPSLPLWFTIPVLVAFALWLLPKIGEWFFVRVGKSRVQRFLFALAGMAAGASLAVAAGLEGIIGAFLAGLGMNRLVPKNSELMERLDFVGSTVFVPAFLVSIGLSIDPAAFFDLNTLGLGLLFTGFVLVGKTLAVAIAARFFRYTFDEAGLMASLSYGQAASTLAIAQVGLSLDLFGQDVVNGAVLAVVLTALATSYGTQFFIRRVPRPTAPRTAVGERILVDVRPAGSNLAAVMEFAGLIARGDDGIVVPYTTPSPGRKEAGRLRMSEAESAAADAGQDTEGVVRVSESFTNGTLELIEESDASMVLLSWRGPTLSSDYVFGNDVGEVGEQAPVASAAMHLIRPWTRVVLVTGNARVSWHSEDADLATSIASRVRRNKNGPVLVIGSDPGVADGALGSPDHVEVVATVNAARELLERVQAEDLVIAPAYVLSKKPVAEQIRLTRRMMQVDLVVVAGPKRLSVGRRSSPHRMEGILGPQQ